MSVHNTAASGFNTTALTSAYEAGRPSYNPELIDTTLRNILAHFEKNQNITNGQHPNQNENQNPHEGKDKLITIVDVAAGTGLSTRILMDRCDALSSSPQYSSYTFKIIAVEPVDAMRQTLTEKLAQRAEQTKNTKIQWEILKGTAQQMPVPDHSVQIVFAFQSFHWFSTVEALEGIHRVLVPNGAFAIVWNTRSRSSAWLQLIEEIIDECYVIETEEQGSEIPRQTTGKWRSAFADQSYFTMPLNEIVEEVGYIQHGNIDTAVNRTLSISVVNQRSQQTKDEIAKKIRHIIETADDIPDKNNLEMPHGTEIYWTFAKPQ